MEKTDNKSNYGFSAKHLKLMGGPNAGAQPKGCGQHQKREQPELRTAR
jgi:hypothetical protein